MNVNALVSDYHRDGYVSGIPFLDAAEVAHHRNALEEAEQQIGGSLHYRFKVHTMLTSPFALATRPDVLDVVEAMIGPDILLYNVTYIIKEPHSPSHVSWHQDLTYWGLSHDDQVTMWLALSVADEKSGCMRMIPGSHTQGRVEHEIGDDENNVLLQSQTVHGVQESQAKFCPLNPGEASFHHGWTLHASMPNHSDDRRIGVNVQYRAPLVRQTQPVLETAILRRGMDYYLHFEYYVPASSDLSPEGIREQKTLEDRYKLIAGQE